jgi:hypothetical protein
MNQNKERKTMKYFKWFVQIIFILVFSSGASLAVAKDYKGKAVIPYKSSAFSSKPSDEIKHKAIEKAKINAWKNYTASFSMARQKDYKKMETEFLNHLDEYIAGLTILADKVDKGTKTYKVIVRININESAVDAKLSAESAAGKLTSGEGSLFSFIFVARETSEVKSYDARKTNITKTESKTIGEEKSAIGNGTMMSGESKKSMQKVQTGGSTVRKADKINWTVSSSQDLDDAINEILSPAGYEVVEYNDVVSECGGAELEVIKREFSTKHEISRQTRKSSLKGARECEVTYFAMGTLDVGMPDTDPNSGLTRVYVSVNAKVWNIEKRLPKRIASVNSDSFAGLGPNSTVAKENALKKAANSAAKAIVDQMNAKNAR